MEHLWNPCGTLWNPAGHPCGTLVDPCSTCVSLPHRACPGPPRSSRRISWNPWWNLCGTLPQGRPRPPWSLSGLRPQTFSCWGKSSAEKEHRFLKRPLSYQTGPLCRGFLGMIDRIWSTACDPPVKQGVFAFPAGNRFPFNNRSKTRIEECV